MIDNDSIMQRSRKMDYSNHKWKLSTEEFSLELNRLINEYMKSKRIEKDLIQGLKDRKSNKTNKKGGMFL